GHPQVVSRREAEVFSRPEHLVGQPRGKRHWGLALIDDADLDFAPALPPQRLQAGDEQGRTAEGEDDGGGFHAPPPSPIPNASWLQPTSRRRTLTPPTPSLPASPPPAGREGASGLKGRQHVAWGASPRKSIQRIQKPRRGDSSFVWIAAAAPSGLVEVLCCLPGADAPGYMLSPLQGWECSAPSSCCSPSSPGWGEGDGRRGPG